MQRQSKLIDFLAHNNAIPIALGIIFLGATSTFAATDPQAVYSTTNKVVSVDNGYIASKDLSTYSPSAVITAVNEDTDTFYVDYQFSTIDIEDGVWKDVVRSKELKVSKDSIAAGETLGSYVSRQLKESVDAEYRRLTETQDIERKNVTQKVVATEYGGLVGTLLNTTTQVSEPYQPPIAMDEVSAPAPSTVAQAAGAAAADIGASPTTTPVSESPPANPDPVAQSAPAKSGTLSLQVVGKTDAHIAKNTSFVDLGVYVTDPPTNDIFTLKIFLDGADVSLNGIQLDTTVLGVHHIHYEATDAKGNKVAGDRTVTVYDPYAQQTSAVDSTATSTVPTSTTP